MTAITSIKKAFQSLGYTVNTRLQESTASEKEIVIIVDDVDYEVETDTSYFCTITLDIIFSETDPDELISKCVLFPSIIEVAIRDQVLNPIIETPAIDNTGHLYQVELYCTYKVVIDIE